MGVTIEEMQALVGWRFPGGSYTIPRWENFLLTDAMCSPQMPGDLAHPAYGFHAPLAGMGISYAEFFELCRAESDDAIRAGEYDFEFYHPLREGQPYTIRGEITDVQRKHGKRSGTFDLVTFRLEMLDTKGRLCVAATNSWVYLRAAP
jgi:acyl dehydratase